MYSPVFYHLLFILSLVLSHSETPYSVLYLLLLQSYLYVFAIGSISLLVYWLQFALCQCWYKHALLLTVFHYYPNALLAMMTIPMTDTQVHELLSLYLLELEQFYAAGCLY